ncbi:low molecular weight phosphatase family protein [Glycomyces algeriensis]|uniref:Low molecular weight phosphatase family protein n=2 Tax=Glycomyces algeriensis TaxID=256037 RepID=A0A9W6GE70_9ACTN|nr:low molecular weight phosphatase family protein [Glycomyces algeriensis]
MMVWIEGTPLMTDTGEFTIPPAVATLLDTSATRLAARFAATFSPETVRECLDDSYIVLAATARVHTHLYVLAERFAAERLSATITANSEAATGKPEILFVCVHNAGRSQMAAALLDHHGAGRVVVRSAGSAPVDSVNPAVVAALAELDLDVSKEFPKPLTDEVVRASDVVITMGCGDACPIYPGKRYLNWELDDPAGKDLEAARRIRDDIDARVKSLLEELLG